MTFDIKRNTLTKIGLGFFYLVFTLLTLFNLLTMLSSNMSFKLKTLILYIPLIMYYIYIKIFVINYYKNKVISKTKLLKEYKLTIDKMLTNKVLSKKFVFYSQGTQINEYYFTFFNKKLSKNVTVSTIKKPSFYNKNLKSWDNSEIIVFLDQNAIKQNYTYNEKSKYSSLSSVRFFKSIYNLEKTYLYHLNESIVKKNTLQGLLFIMIPAFITIYLMSLLLHYN